MDTPDGFQRLAPGRLTASTLNRHRKRLSYDQERMTRQPPAVRFQAERSNALWHFDMSPSDLKHLKAPPWLDPERAGAPTLMLCSVVDDRSGIAYQKYRCVYGEDVEAALRFLFDAMSPKPAAADGEADPFQGIPAMIYLDNGPMAKSAVFKCLIELVAKGGGQLSIVLVGHTRLKNDLRRPKVEPRGSPGMQEIGDRTTVFEFGGLRDSQRDYIDWVLASLYEGVAPDDMLTDEAATLLAAKLKTPLQIGQHLVRAVEAGFEIGAEPIMPASSGPCCRASSTTWSRS